MKKTIAAAAVGGLLFTTGITLAQDAPENLVDYRQNVMGALAGHISAIASVAKGETSYTGHVDNHARALADMGAILETVFPEGTSRDDISDSYALAKIWAEPEAFAERVEAFQDAAADLVVAAESGDRAAIGAAVGPLGKACGDCHKPYRHEDE